jgi:hypothetical protein
LVGVWYSVKKNTFAKKFGLKLPMWVISRRKYNDNAPRWGRLRQEKVAAMLWAIRLSEHVQYRHVCGMSWGVQEWIKLFSLFSPKCKHLSSLCCTIICTYATYLSYLQAAYRVRQPSVLVTSVSCPTGDWSLSLRAFHCCLLPAQEAPRPAPHLGIYSQLTQQSIVVSQLLHIPSQSKGAFELQCYYRNVIYFIAGTAQSVWWLR